MNVVFLSLDLFSFGGIQRYSRYVLRALRRSSFASSLHVASFATERGGAFDGEIEPEVTGRGSSPLQKAAFALDTLRMARRARASLVICDHINLAPLGYLCSRVTRSQLWVSVYAIEVWGELSFLRRRALLAADAIVSDCDFTRRLLEERYPALAGRISVVPDCVDVARFTPAGMEGERAPLVLLTVSRLVAGRSKGHDGVMKAMTLLGSRGIETRYVVVGDGADRTRLERLTESMGLAGRVEFRGAVPDSELPSLYRECDVFVLVSGFRLGGVCEGEGVPLVVLEAQASGKPAITSALDGSAESIIDGETGFAVDPSDIDAVAAALERLAIDPGLRQRMGNAARTLSEEQFAFEVFESRLARVLAVRAAQRVMRSRQSAPEVVR